MGGKEKMEEGKKINGVNVNSSEKVKATIRDGS